MNLGTSLDWKNIWWEEEGALSAVRKHNLELKGISLRVCVWLSGVYDSSTYKQTTPKSVTQLIS